MIIGWYNEQDAIDALNTINERYGLAYVSSSGYVASNWDTLKKAENTDIWYINKPKDFRGRDVNDIMENIVQDIELEVTPSEWFNE